ncbi:acyl-CoA dehydrogenase family protein [Mycobacterium sp. shizuoka-1]|uniref:acyl-CoA dehydrogenase family protein n=1 Tax=Mycobacterium sp. shizuoka-1 TaxID=2039281 RepID=UPI000C05D894|nr:acyl-CoA dehydrogenase family protein [Mycobacterium sp. shizuoka-1]GAY15567.1 acyl-CoA dehydrogenase [Mycobacterium sp. shizuoka-1]
MLNQDMTDEEFAPYFAQAQEVSQFFREIGPKYDQENTFAYPSIDVFKKSGLGGLPVPKEYGGGGGNILHVSKIVSELSRGDSAITLAYNMHYIMVGIAGNLMSEEQKKHWLGRVADGDLIFGPFSEKRAGFSGLADMQAVPQPGGGWKLYGKKTWGTLCEAADIITTNATETDAEGNLPDTFEGRIAAEKLFVGDFKVDENGIGDGVRIEKTWNALGMHATGTQVIHFDGYYVPEDGFICPWRAGAFGVLEWASLMFASIYLGMQYRILEESVTKLSKKHLGATFGAIVAADTEVKNVGHIIDGIGDMATKVQLSKRVVYQTCEDLIHGRDKDWAPELRFPYLGIAKTFTSENVMYMARRAMSMVGGESFRKGTIFERLYRDSAASMFQPLNADQTQTYIGEFLLNKAAADAATKA